MNGLLNRYASKLSQNTFLSGPPDDTNLGTGKVPGNQQAPTPGVDNSLEDSGNADDDDDSDISDDDVKKLLGGTGFEVEEEDVDTDEARTQRRTEHDNLGKTLQESLKAFKFDEEDIMEDYDPSDRKSVAKMLSGVQQKSLAKAMELTIPVIEQAMKVTVAHVEKMMEAKFGRNQKKNEAEEIFEGLGYEAPADKTLARTIYQNALASKMSPQDAGKATRKAMSSLGKAATKKKNTANSSGVRTGAAALDDIFG